MTIEEAIRHAGNLQLVPPEIRADIAMHMPRYLWIDNNHTGDTGLPEYDIPDRPHRLIHCEVCGGEALQERRRGMKIYRQNDEVACPFCGARVIAKHIAKGIKNIYDRLDVVYYLSSALDPEVLVAYAAHCVRPFGLADAREPWAQEIIIEARGLAVFDAARGESIRLQTSPVFEHDGGHWELTGILWKQVKSMKKLTFGGNYGFMLYAPERVILTDSLAAAIEGTAIGRAWSPSYWGDGDGIEALDMICRYPCLEYLTKLGMDAFLARKLCGDLPPHTVNWRGRDMASVLRLSRRRLGEIKGKRISLTPALAAVLQVADADGVRCGIGTAYGVSVACRGLGVDLKAKLRGALARFEPNRRHKALKYMAKYSDCRLPDFEDFWRMTAMAGGSLSVDETAFPRDFRAAHDRIAQRRKYIRAGAFDTQIRKRWDELNRRYGFAFGGLILRPAVDGAEIVREGEVLHHCVGGYVDAYGAGATVICVLRRAVEPDTPWRTVEISKDGRVVQDRGIHNDWGEWDLRDAHYRAMLELFWQAWRERRKSA